MQHSVESTIQKVVCFLENKAQLFRTGKVTLPIADNSVDHTLTFTSTGGWNSVNRDTLQVSTSVVGDKKDAAATLILRSVGFTTLHDIQDVRPLRREIEEKLAALEDPMQTLLDEIQLAGRAIANLEALRTKLTQKMQASTKGSAFVYDAASWQKFGAFIAEELRALRGKKRDVEGKRAELQQRKDDLEGERRRLGPHDEKKTSREVAEVVLSVVPRKKDAKSIDVEVMLSMLCSGAGWTPTYDLRVDKTERRMGVTYNAMVRQHTGEDWSNVRLELSTSKSSVGGKIPDWPSPWYLRARQNHFVAQREQQEYQQINLMSNMMMQQMMPAPPAAGGGGGGAARSGGVFAAATGQQASVSSSSTSSTFTIVALTSVKSDNEPVKVTIGLFEVGAFFRYSSVPKLDSNVYCKVKCENTSAFNLLAGKATIFSDSQLVGSTTMDDVAPGEEWWTFLGRDESISCTRKEITKKTVSVSGGVFGKDKTRIEYSYSFTCKNNKQSGEEVVVWDQMPISSDSRIVVTQVTPPSTGKSDPFHKVNDQKMIEWFLQPLLGGQERTWQFEFHVEHDKEIAILL